LICPQFISTKIYADKNLTKKIKLLIDQLSAGYKVRKNAKKELLVIGKAAIQSLTSHKTDDFETSLLIKEILKELQSLK
jgi:hypothetical protein